MFSTVADVCGRPSSEKSRKDGSRWVTSTKSLGFGLHFKRFWHLGEAPQALLVGFRSERKLGLGGELETSLAGRSGRAQLERANLDEVDDLFFFFLFFPPLFPSFFFSFFCICLKRKSEKTKIARPKINKQKCPPCGRTSYSNYRKPWAPRPQQLFPNSTKFRRF